MNEVIGRNAEIVKHEPRIIGLLVSAMTNQDSSPFEFELKKSGNRQKGKITRSNGRWVKGCVPSPTQKAGVLKILSGRRVKEGIPN